MKVYAFRGPAMNAEDMVNPLDLYFEALPGLHPKIYEAPLSRVIYLTSQWKQVHQKTLKY